MIVTVVVVVCHTIAAVPGAPVCREEIVARADAMQACLINQPAIADWKAHSQFRGDQWTIARIKCIPGDYVLKERV